MKFGSYPGIVPTEYYPNDIRRILKANVKTDGFIGALAQIEMELAYDLRGQAFGEGVSLPRGGALSYLKAFVPLKEVVVPAEITQQALDLAGSEQDAWGRVVDRTLRMQRTDFEWLMQLIAAGDGTGRLARVLSCDTGGSVTADRIRICCDNTYSDFGSENVANIKVGQWVEIYNAAGALATDGNGVVKWQVTKVWFGDRDNGRAVTPAYTSGSEVACFEIICADAQHATVGAFCDDGALVHIAGTRSMGVTTDTSEYFVVGGSASQLCYRAYQIQGSVSGYCSLPMGLGGIIQSALANQQTDAAIDCTLDTFQGLARASYATLNAHIFDGDNIGGSEGVPGDWGISTISRALTQIRRDTGHWPNLLACSMELAEAIDRRNKSELPISVVVDSAEKLRQVALSGEFVTQFKRPDGKVIPVEVWETCPKNVLKIINTDFLQWYSKGGFDYKRFGDSGGVWNKSYGDRLANVECHFGGYEQLAAPRCDVHGEIQDMRDDI